MSETTLAFGADGGLIGTITHPDKPAPEAVGMVLFNAGVIQRIGPHRINVKLARTLARHGIPTIRFDMHGMGDSQRPNGRLDYKAQVIEDLRAAMDALAAATGTQHFALLGFCSGAMPSYWAAQADPRVRHIILYDAFDLRTSGSHLRYFLLRLRSHGFGLSALRIYLQRLGGHLQQWRDTLRERTLRAEVEQLSGDDGTPALSTLAAGFRELAARGVKVAVLHAGADFSNVNAPAQIARAFRLEGAQPPVLRTGLLASIDHTMTSINAQHAFIDWICAEVRDIH